MTAKENNDNAMTVEKRPARATPVRTIPLEMALRYIVFAPFLILLADRSSQWLLATDGERFRGWPDLERLALILGTAGFLAWLLAVHLSRLVSANQELGQTEKHFRTLYDAAPVACHSLDSEGIILEVNQAWLELTGRARGDVLGHPFTSFLSEPHQEVFRQNFPKLKATGKMPVTEYDLQSGTGASVAVSIKARVVYDENGNYQHTQCILFDITERRRHTQEVERLNRLYAVLSQVNQAVVHAHTRQEVCEQVCQAALAYGGFKLAWIAWLDPLTREIRPLAHRGEIGLGLQQLQVSADGGPGGRGPTGTAIREKRTVLCNDLAQDPEMVLWRELAAQYGVASAAAFPIRVGDEVCGALVLYAAEPAFFQRREVLLLEEAASDVSFALNVLESNAQRKLAEAALQESEARHRFLAENITDVVWLLDLATMRFQYVSPSVERLRGYSSEEVMRMRPWETMTPASWSELEGRIPARRKAFLAGDAEAVVEQHEIQQARRDGTLVWTEMITTLVGDAKTGLRVLGVSRDITKRKEAQEALSQQEARLSSLLRALPSGVGIARHRVITEVNDRVCELSGYSREELLGRNTRLFYATDEDCHRARQELYGTVHDRKIGSAECRWKRKDGEIYDVLINSSVLDPADPETITFTVTDISALKLAEARIHTLSQAVEQSPVSVVITDLEGNIEYVNPRFTEVTGYAAEEVLGKNPRILKSGDTPTEVYAQIWSTIQVGGQWRGELKNKKKNGEFCWELASVSPIRDARGEITRFLAVKVDITDSKRLEEQVLRSQRMESIGTLASGVAHDLNNILAPIMLAIDVLREGERSPQDSTMLQMLAQGTQRGAGIVKQLLMFGRGMGGQRATFLPHPVLREMAKVIKETFPKSITLEQRFHQELWPIHADATQIHQVLLNLCVNARDAMPHGGKLTIAAQNLFLDEDYVRKNPDARIGPFVVLQITDTGCGIRPELLEKIFDPFFTTKDLGKGTGLGLSTVLGIVKGHGGFVQIASRVGEGTQFQAYLPAMESGSVQTGTPGLQRLPQGHGELVLIVDDEEAICNIARRMLEKNGYRVLTVQNGAEGLVACSQHRTHVQAVITDMVMPVMDGATLIRVLRDYAPNLKIIAMTGLAPQEEKAFKPVLSADAFLCKPFTPEQLLVTLSKVLTPEPEIVEFPQIEIATSPEDPNALIPAALPSA